MLLNHLADKSLAAVIGRKIKITKFDKNCGCCKWPKYISTHKPVTNDDPASMATGLTISESESGNPSKHSFLRSMHF